MDNQTQINKPANLNEYANSSLKDLENLFATTKVLIKSIIHVAKEENIELNLSLVVRASNIAKEINDLASLVLDSIEEQQIKNT